MGNSDPIAIVSGIVLILVVILLLFMLFCVARRSAKDVWIEHHRQSLKAKQRPVAEWRASLKHQVQAEWQRDNEEDNEEEAQLNSQPPSQNQPHITVTAASPSKLPPALTIGHSNQAHALGAEGLLENPAPPAQSALQRSLRKRPTMRGWSPLRFLPKFFFEERKYTHVPYFEGDDSGIELKAQFNQSHSTPARQV